MAGPSFAVPKGAEAGGRMMRAARRIGALSGWRRAGASIALGAAASLAQPPWSALPLLLLAFPGLLWLLDGARTARTAFLTGWCFGFGYLLVGLYWIGHAFLVEADRFAWLLPFAVSLLPAGLALFIALGVLAAWLAAPPGAGRVLALAAAWTLAEWLRAHLFTGFPWHLAGYVWAPSDAMLQAAALFGIYGLSALTVMAAAAPAALLAADRRSRAGAIVLGAAALALGATWLGGAVRLAGAEAAVVDGVTLRLVQPNIPQAEKWLPAHRERHFQQHLSLSLTDAPGTKAVIWPETATSFFTALAPELRQVMAGVLSPGDLLITGSPRRGERTPAGYRIFNSLHVLQHQGEIVASYDKHHLVPFGEYVPFRPVLAALGIEGLAAGQGDFAAGDGPEILRLPGLPPVQPLICYEVIFPHEVGAAGRPGWLLNLTNDAWFGDSAGPYQHFAMARVRAVEQGLPLVRVANTGISGVIDPYGRTLARLELGATGALDHSLPQALPPTLYARFGDPLPISALALVLAALAVRRRIRRDPPGSPSR